MRLQNTPFQHVVQYKEVPKCGLGYLAYKSPTTHWNWKKHSSAFEISSRNYILRLQNFMSSLGTSGHYTIYDYTEHKLKNKKKVGGGGVVAGNKAINAVRTP